MFSGPLYFVHGTLHKGYMETIDDTTDQVRQQPNLKNKLTEVMLLWWHFLETVYWPAAFSSYQPTEGVFYLQICSVQFQESQRQNSLTNWIYTLVSDESIWFQAMQITCDVASYNIILPY